MLTPNAAAALRRRGSRSPSWCPRTARSAYVTFTFNIGEDGWHEIPEPSRRSATSRRSTASPSRRAASAARPPTHRALRGLATQPAGDDPAGGDRHPAVHLPQPGPVDPPDHSAVVSPTPMSGGVVYLLAKYADLTVNGQSQSILGILVIGAGTDYALLLVARYREELRRHEDRHEAMAFALHRAAPASVASAATVVVGMLCLSFADLNSTPGLGPVLAVGVAVTFLVMITSCRAALWSSAAAGCSGRKRPGVRLRASRKPATGFWVSGGRPASPPRPRKVWAVTAGPAAGCASPGPVQARRRTGCRPRTSYTKKFDSITGPEAADRPRPVRQLQHRPGGGQHRPGRRGGQEAMAGHRRPRAAADAPAGDRRRPRPTSRRPWERHGSSRAAPSTSSRTRATRARRRRRRRPGRRRLGLLSRHQDHVQA